MYFVYLAECKDKTIYTGITTDLDRRLKEHQTQKGGHYTRAHQVKKIVYTEKHPTRSVALRREAEIKSWKRNKKLDLIKTKKRIG
ncbi:MAG: GIY-YIG nuclease family protein [Patescibacteria group bacterium]